MNSGDLLLNNDEAFGLCTNKNRSASS